MGIEEAVKSCPSSVAKREEEEEEKQKIFAQHCNCDPGGLRYTEFVTIDLRNRQVLECPYALYGCVGWNSMVSLGSVVYVVGASNPELINFCTKPPDSKLDKKGIYHKTISYLDIADDTVDGWKPAPCPTEGPRPNSDPPAIAFGGKIYFFQRSFESKEAKVFDPVLNEWETLLPPYNVGVFSICYGTSVVADSQNNRILIHFNNVKSVFAYYPAHNQWELVLKPFDWSDTLVFADGVIFIYLPESPEVVAAYDVATKQWLNNVFTSDLSERVWIYRYDAMIYLGNGLMCLARDFSDIIPPQTDIYLIKFRFERSSDNPADLLITPLPEDTYTVDLCGYGFQKYLPI